MRLHLWPDDPNTCPILWAPTTLLKNPTMVRYKIEEFVPEDSLSNLSHDRGDEADSIGYSFDSSSCESSPHPFRAADWAEHEGSHSNPRPHSLPELPDLAARVASTLPRPLEEEEKEVPTIRLKSIYFLHGDPIYKIDHNGRFVALPRLNHDKEFKLVREAMDGKPVQMVIRKLTFRALSDTFSNKDCKVLHWASHGFKGYLGIEDHEELGKMNLLLAHELKERIRHEAPNVELVVVSACRTEIIGKALIEAGVKNVVCIRHCSDIGDEVAIYFAHCFYKHLVSEREGLNVQQAFDLAVSDVGLRHSQLEANKFVLFRSDPDKPSMKIELANTSGETPAPLLYGSKAPPDFPRPPGNLVGREKEIRLVNNGVHNKRLVRVYGPPDVGKAEVCVAACHYLWERLYFNGLNLHAIRWFVFTLKQPPRVESCPVQTIIFDAIRDPGVSEHMFMERIQANMHVLTEALLQHKDLLVFEAKKLSTQEEARKMALFIQTLLCKSDEIKIVVIYDDVVDVNPDKTWVYREDIWIGPMNMEMSLKLCKEHLKPEIIDATLHGMTNPKDFFEWIYDSRMESWIQCDNASQEAAPSWGYSWFRSRDIESADSTRSEQNANKLVELAQMLYKCIGKGKAKNIRANGSQMDSSGHSKLVGIRNQMMDIMLDDESLTEILANKRVLTDKLKVAKTAQNYLECDWVQGKIDKLEMLRQNHPDLSESLNLEHQTEIFLARAVHYSHWRLADLLKTRKAQIQRLVEVNRAEEERNMNDICPGTPTISTRFQLERIISKKACLYESALDDEYYHRAAELTEQICFLRSLRGRLPQRKVLEAKQLQVALQKASAKKDEMNSVVEVLGEHLKALSLQIDLEKKECEAYQRNVQLPMCMCGAIFG